MTALFGLRPEIVDTLAVSDDNPAGAIAVNNEFFLPREGLGAPRTLAEVSLYADRLLTADLSFVGGGMELAYCSMSRESCQPPREPVSGTVR